jgi:hypothetical protein
VIAIARHRLPGESGWGFTALALGVMGLLTVQVIYDNAPWSWVIWPLIVALLSTILIIRLFLQ